MRGLQLSFSGVGEPSIDEDFASLRRIELGRGVWVDHAREWVAGHDALFVAVRAAMRWRAQRRVMYERVVDVPRLLAKVPEDGDGHPLVHRMANVLSERYGVRFDSITMALYRDGSDSVAWHRDKVADRDRAIVCVLTLGGSRRFMLRPFGGGGATALTIGGGDLVVMGGTCQRTFEHCVPKTARHADPRLAIMFRHSSYEGLG